MPRVPRVLTYIMIGVLAVTTPMAYAAEAPAGIASQADLDRALATSAHQEDAARDTIKSLLHREDVAAIAAGAGLDLRRAEAAVGTLQGDELQSLAAQAANVDSQLAGGDTIISISLVTLLLIIIIVILVSR